MFDEIKKASFSPKKLDYVIILLVIIIMILLIVTIPHEQGSYAYVYVNNEIVETLDLNINGEYIIYTEGDHYNIIVVENNSIRVSDADCDDKICVHFGAKWLSGDRIVCIPHKLVIVIGGEPIVEGIA